MKYSFPKVDLHLHLDGSFRISSMYEMAQERGIKLPGESEEGYAAWMKKCSDSNSVNDFLKMFDPEMHLKSAKTIAKELGVIQENDLGALEAIVDAVLAKPETKKAQDDFRAGEEKVIGFLVGQVMKESKGKANPSAVQQILRQKLS